ncbi:bifunctional diguanylate cyclase/phosphodiesterase [Sulfurimonas sp. C5]|uniref:EAL domain-containing protein n=1 Tax=Sulfurimonas sp. C5 TaxID=3036947 RepID=UPI00245850F6|nr:bifunctional diguanylate cyclase/phosphodiesterase [Sulfurimonas sp. C5]MDH4944258.1 bifunctional diguanylate cyclase/phosphodiesterase [Sulfurimonas sp. C5]
MKIEFEEKLCDCYVDPLTGLYNRLALLEYIKTNKEYTLFILDIDNFSNINNTYGYLIGDEILKNIANYLKMLKPAHGEIFRFDGDQFVFLTDQLTLNIEKEEIAQIVISFFNEMDIYETENSVVKIFFSIGIYTGQGYKLLNNANLALDDARQYKKNSYKLFDQNSSFIKNHLQHIDWIKNVRQYMEDEKFVLFYQPIIDNRTNKVVKYECLIRISNGTSYITPDNFMYACRVTGILELITRFVIKTAFEKFSKTEYSFSINITSDDINLEYLEDLLLEKCEQYNIPPSRVILEILEDITTLTKPYMLTQITSLREKGFKIALDDFGIENSNFARLIDFHPDFIKIDGVFIKDIVENTKNQIVVQTIVDFCKLCNIEVVAEFVHNKEVLEKVREFDIEFSQGFYLGKPQKELLED